MVPVSTFLYGRIGLSPLLMVNGISFFLAAVLETRIRAEEDYIIEQEAQETPAEKSLALMLTDTREGFLYLAAEKGLLAIAACFAFSSICGGVSSVIILPCFKKAFAGGEYWYMFVMGFSLAGRAL